MKYDAPPRRSNRDLEGVEVSFNSSEFYPCNDRRSKCTIQGVVGSVGTCNLTTLLCECPSGYNGYDDFDLYNDCHVKISAQTTARVIGAVICGICFIVSLFVLFRLCKFWGLIYVPNQDQQQQGGGTTRGARTQGMGDKTQGERTNGDIVKSEKKTRATKGSKTKNEDDSEHDDTNPEQSSKDNATLVVMALSPRDVDDLNKQLILEQNLQHSHTEGVEEEENDNDNDDDDEPQQHQYQSHENQHDSSSTLQRIPSKDTVPTTTSKNAEGVELVMIITSSPKHQPRSSILKSSNVSSSNLNAGSRDFSSERATNNNNNNNNEIAENEAHSTMGLKKYSDSGNIALMKKKRSEAGIFETMNADESDETSQTQPRKSRIEAKLSLVRQGAEQKTREISRKLTAEVKRLPRPSISAVKELAPGMNAPIAVVANSSVSAMVFEKKRKRQVISLATIFAFLSLNLFVYEILLLKNRTHAVDDAYGNFVLATIITLVFWALWILLLSWFGSLPSLAAFGKMFNINSVLLRRPELMEMLVYAHLFVSASIGYTLLFILPLVAPEGKYAYDTAMLVFIILFSADFLVLFYMICIILLKQFTALESRFQSKSMIGGAAGAGVITITKPLDAADLKKKNSILRAKRIVVNAFILSMILGPFGITLAIIVLTPQGRANSWIVAQFCIISGAPLSLYMIYQTIQKTIEASKRKKEALENTRLEISRMTVGQGLTSNNANSIARLDTQNNNANLSTLTKANVIVNPPVS